MHPKKILICLFLIFALPLVASPTSKILVIGVGYVGLVTAASFAEMGHEVICLDIDEDRIEGLRHGMLPYYEPGLQELVMRNIQNNRLSFTTSYHNADFCFISVPTPEGENGSADLSYIHAVANTIGEKMDGTLIVVIKSTVPPGTADQVREIIKRQLREICRHQF